MKKRVLIAALAVANALCLGLSACGGGDGETGGSGSGSGEQTHTHSFTWVYNDDATCLEDGTETGTCACGETQTRTKTGSALGHDIKPLPARGATCSQSGYSAHNGCVRCGYTADKNVTYTDALHLQYQLNEAGNGYTVVIVNEDCDDLAIEIPYYYKGLPVTAIGDGAFMGIEGEWVEPTPDGESYWYPGHLLDLESVTIPDSVKTIGEEAFTYCRSLASIDIPNGVTKIAAKTFCQCFSLENIAIPENVTSIGDLAFSGCTSLESVTFAENIKLTSTGWGVFSDCSSLESIVLPQGLNTIEHKMFDYCYSLKSCTIPEGVTSIGNFTFNGCALTNITLPESLTSIGDFAFSGCSLLTKFTISKNVTSIGELAFTGCFNIWEVWNFSALPIEKGAENFGGVALNAKYVYTTKEESKQVLTDDNYLFFEDEEGSLLLFYYGNETSLTLPALSPKGKQYGIYSSAFNGCHLLESVLLTEGVTSIDNGAFTNCGLLTSIMIPKSVTKIGPMAFFRSSIRNVYYGGTQVDWNKIEITDGNSEGLSQPVTIYYFSEEVPTEEEWAEWNYWWHFDETTGEVVEWAKP